MKTHKIRVRPYFITCLKYLEWKALLSDIEREKSKLFVLDKVITKMKETLEQKQIFLEFEKFKGYRHDQRFSLSESAVTYIKEFAEKNNLLIAESVEILLYLYCNQNLDSEEFKQCGLGYWGINVSWEKKGE